MENTKPQATAEAAKRVEEIESIFRKESCPENSDELGHEFAKLTDEYDWMSYEFEENGRKGMKDVLGKVLVPAEYDDFGCSFSYNYSPITIPVKKDGKWGLVSADGTNTVVADFVYSDIDPLGYNFERCYFFKEEGLDTFGLMSEDGKVLVPNIITKCADPARMYTFFFKSGDKYGLYMRDRDLYLEPVYDSIECDDFNVPMTFVKDGVEGCVDYKKRFFSKEYLERMEHDSSLEYIEEIDLLRDWDGID